MNPHLTRKDFLKIGAVLPFALQSLASAPKPKAPPRRVLFICNSLGFYAPSFFPKTRGDLNSSTYLAGLETPEKITVFENLFHPGMDTSNHDSEKSFLTGTPYPESQSFRNGMSLDQVLAEQLGGETRYPFLSFSIYDRGWGCSWNKRGVAIPPMHDVSRIFDKLFGKEDLSAKRTQIRQDQAVVQALYRDMAHLKRKGANTDKIASYRSVITELEAQLKHQSFWLDAAKPSVPNTLSDDAEFAFSTKVRNLFELSKLALQTDSTRVLTLSLDWIYGAINVPGATGGWHTLSHHGGKQDALDKLARIEVDVIKHFNRFLADLDAIPEGQGSLLDHTSVVFGSNFGDASNHTCNKLPTLVAGGGYRHQAHTVLEQPTHLCNLWLELLHKHNIDAGSFGNSERDMQLLKT